VVRRRSGAALRGLKLVLLLFFLQPPLTAAVAAADELLAPGHVLTTEVRERLLEAAGDPALEAWQRDFAARLAGGAGQPEVFEPGWEPPASTLTTAGGSWVELHIAPRRQGHTAIYDPVRDRMVVFGGTQSPPYLNDVWALTLSGTPAWSQITPSGTPPSARVFHSAIYDPVRDRMVVFGGQNAGGYLNEVWAISLSGNPAWSQLTPGGAPPNARNQHAAVYDPVRDRMLVFGGWGTGPQLLNDAWALSLSGSPTWSQISPGGAPPSARAGHTAIYDPVRDRIAVFGGGDAGGYLNDVWALTLSGSPGWIQITPGGTPPSARTYHSAIYDRVRDRIVVFGGAGTLSAYLNDVWALSLSGSPVWSQITPGGSPPSARYHHTAIYDPVRDRMVMFAGQDVSYFNDLWSLSLSGSPAWSRISPGGAPPSARAGHTASYDPVRNRMVVFGGGDAGGYLNDVWALTLSGSPGWIQLTPGGTPPSARTYHSAIYDPVRDRIVVFGGTGTLSAYLNDVWALSLSGSPVWSQVTPGGTPPSARYHHTAIYDPVRDRMVVFGGQDVSYFNDLWSLSLSGSPAWSQISPGGTPPQARSGHTAIYDPVRDRMVVFGGTQSPPSFNDVWALTLSGSAAWSQITPVGTPPSARYDHSAIYDPVRDCMVVFGGQNAGGYLNEVWAISLSGNPAWTHNIPGGTPPGARVQHAAVYDPMRDRMFMFGGWGTPPHLLNDFWSLDWAGLVGVRDSAAVPGHLELAPPRPNPFRGRVAFDFELPRTARVRLEIHDLQGRRLRTVEDALLPAGHYSRTWDGSDLGGAPLPGGVYLMRLWSPEVARVQKVVLIR